MTRRSRTALGEMWLILATWCAFCAWVIMACAPAFRSMEADDATATQTAASDSLNVVWGLPAWVFWGIAVPWAAATTWTLIFAVFGLKDDDAAEAEHD